MVFELIEKARPYWLIANRYHSSSRGRLKAASAVFEMRNMEDEGVSEAVDRRVKGFISKHRRDLLGSEANEGSGDIA